jgi:Pyruvate/2-oxoacid:ferredoxin oxidoreductase delta subunit
MIRSALTFLVLFSAFQSMASAEVVSFNPFETSFSLATNTNDFMIDSVKVVKVATKMEIDTDCDTDVTSYCARTVLASTDAVLVTVYYNNESDEESLGVVKAYLPTTSFSNETLAEIKTASHYTFDMLGKKGRALKALANKLFALKLTETVQTIPVIDSAKSTICEIGESFCEEVLVYKNVQVKNNNIEVVRK